VPLAPGTRPADNVDTRREERNARQRKRRAKMTDQQREEINRKQREYYHHLCCVSNSAGILTRRLVISTTYVFPQPSDISWAAVHMSRCKFLNWIINYIGKWRVRRSYVLATQKW
jgi:hypothetical protein